MQKKKVFVTSQYLITDPPTKNVVENLFKTQYEVIYVQQSQEIEKGLIPEGIVSINIRLYSWLPFHFLRRLVNFIFYKWKINQLIIKHRPDIVIGIMYQPISVIRVTKAALFIAAILDIPVIDYSGKYDKIILSKAFKKLPHWHFVWASDEYKAGLIKELCNLPNEPIICYNCPPSNYLQHIKKNETRNWLISRLIVEGIAISTESIILLRAGAIGPYGGIEETIMALKDADPKFIFILMGRPEKNYIDKLNCIIKENNLLNRVYIFNRPDDTEWKQILFASDVGHLIHLKATDNKAAQAVYEYNSSLSNNRLYQYMAAGLSILSYNDPRLQLLYNEVDCFYIVDSNDIVQSLKQAFNGICGNHIRRKEMGKNAFKAFKEKYNWENQFFKMLNKF